MILYWFPQSLSLLFFFCLSFTFPFGFLLSVKKVCFSYEMFLRQLWISLFGQLFAFCRLMSTSKEDPNLARADIISCHSNCYPEPEFRLFHYAWRQHCLLLLLNNFSSNGQNGKSCDTTDITAEWVLYVYQYVYLLLISICTFLYIWGDWHVYIWIFRFCVNDCFKYLLNI